MYVRSGGSKDNIYLEAMSVKSTSAEQHVTMQPVMVKTVNYTLDF